MVAAEVATNRASSGGGVSPMAKLAAVASPVSKGGGSPSAKAERAEKAANAKANAAGGSAVVLQLTKTKMCAFFERGKCASADCRYAHSANELRAMPNLQKTKLCRSFLQGNCQDENCGFAHGEGDLKVTKGVYKTQMCNFFERGYCKKGDRCNHAHGNKDLRPAAADVLSPAARTPSTTASSDLSDVALSPLSTDSDNRSLRNELEALKVHCQELYGRLQLPDPSLQPGVVEAANAAANARRQPRRNPLPLAELISNGEELTTRNAAANQASEEAEQMLKEVQAAQFLAATAQAATEHALRQQAATNIALTPTKSFAELAGLTFQPQPLPPLPTSPMWSSFAGLPYHAPVTAPASADASPLNFGDAGSAALSAAAWQHSMGAVPPTTAARAFEAPSTPMSSDVTPKDRQRDLPMGVPVPVGLQPRTPPALELASLERKNVELVDEDLVVRNLNERLASIDNLISGISNTRLTLAKAGSLAMEDTLKGDRSPGGAGGDHLVDINAAAALAPGAPGSRIHKL